MEFKSGDVFFYKKFLLDLKKIRELVREDKMEKTKARREIDVEQFIVE